MIGESLAILAVIGVMMVMFAKAGKQRYCALALPLISIPLLHCIGTALQMHAFLFWFDLAGLVIGIGCIIAASRPLQQGSRWGYLLFGIAFLVALWIAYTIN